LVKATIHSQAGRQREPGDQEGGGGVMVRGKLEVLLISAKGLDDSDFFST
jgi:hypothetical protein